MEKYIALVTSCISSGSCILVFLSFFNSLEYVCTYTRYVCRYIQSMDSEFSPIILIHVQLVVDGILFRFTDNCVKKCVYVHIFYVWNRQMPLHFVSVLLSYKKQIRSLNFYDLQNHKRDHITINYARFRGLSYVIFNTYRLPSRYHRLYSPLPFLCIRSTEKEAGYTTYDSGQARLGICIKNRFCAPDSLNLIMFLWFIAEAAYYSEVVSSFGLHS